MDLLLDSRDKLINAIDFVFENIRIETDLYHYKNYIKEEILIPIKNDRLGDYLTSTYDPEIVEFRKSSSHKEISSLARYCRRKLNIKNIPDFVLEMFCKQVKIQLTSIDSIEKDISIIPGQEIPDYYKELGRISSLRSCMTGESYYKTVIYALNPKKVKLVVFAKKSRALLWTTDDGSIVLDRVYPTDGSYHSELLKKWAKEKGYLQYPSIDRKLSITLIHNNVFPFLDTFYNGRLSNNKIKLSNSKLLKQDSYLRATDGSLNFIGKCFFCNESKKPHYEFIPSIQKYVCGLCMNAILRRCTHCDDFHFEKDLTKINKYTRVCKKCLHFYCKKCTNCKSSLTKDYYKVIINGFEKNLCEECSINYYTCYKCNNHFDQLLNPKAIKHGAFFCKSCS